MIFRKWLLSYRRRKALRNIRHVMWSFGSTLWLSTDEQIERRLISASKKLANAGITVEQFSDGIGRALGITGE